MPTSPDADFVLACGLDELPVGARRVVKLDGKQIALFHGEKGVYACNNRCPHEGYPLSEGKLSEGCILTCNWHNWKFDLDAGKTLVGEDKLRRYPAEVRDGKIWLDVSDPPPAQIIAGALDSLQDSFQNHEYGRMARELVRLTRAGGDPLEAPRQAIHWSHEQFEFGATHAHGAAADWLAIREAYGGGEASDLVPLLEIIGHLNWDSLRAARFPYAEGRRDYSGPALVAALQEEDEASAVRLVRGALAQGLDYDGIAPALYEAALAHYQDFGHSAIYVVKIGDLIARLGPEVAEPLLLLLVRSLAYARREDLIPEFSHYGDALAAMAGAGKELFEPEDVFKTSVNKALERVVAGGSDAAGTYDVLLEAAARQMLHFKLEIQSRSDNPVSQNVSWLDFTHAITFANAVRRICARRPDLWPAGLLQMACFLGRNGAFVNGDLDEAVWRVRDPASFLDDQFRALFDHGQFEYIVSCHLVKLLSAVADEWRAKPGARWQAPLFAALNRFLHSPLKRKHALRTVNQAIALVGAED